MEAGELTDEEFFSTLHASGTRALLIGRRALIVLGAPLVTADYDLWLHIDDIERLNAAFATHYLEPNRDPASARQTGRYVLENGERVDVMVARSKSTPAGETLAFDAAWARRQLVAIAPDVVVQLPNLSDLITTKRWASRPKDLVDIEYLEQLARGPTS